MNITIPQGVVAGQVLQVQTPDGRTVQIPVPAGAQPGMVFQVRV